MDFGYWGEEDRPATDAEAAQEWVQNAGFDSPDSEWLLTSYDAWVRNPYYQGEPGPHPEDDRSEGPELAWDDPDQLDGLDRHEAAMNPASVLPGTLPAPFADDDIPF